MAPRPSSARSGCSRRAFLAASGAGLAVLLAGCTDEPAPPRERVTSEQADGLAAQVRVQETLVAAFAAAATTDPALAAAVAEQAGQADEQLQRLRAAAPAGASGGSAASSTAPAPPAGPEARAWLRTQVADAAASHASACLDQSGARAALLGSIAAGLRGQAAVLA